MNMRQSDAAAGVTFRRYDAAGARAIRDVVQRIHQDSYIEAIASGDPFDSAETFMQRFDSYASRDGLDVVVAFVGDEPAGQSWGWPLEEGARLGWWAGLQSDLGEEFTREDGHRTFALSEIMVRQPYTGQHIARALHEELLSARNEERATLLVEPDNERAYRSYLRWGWRKAAELRPAWPNAPLFDVLMLDLALRRSGARPHR